MKRPKEGFLRVGRHSALTTEILGMIAKYQRQAMPGVCPHTGENIHILVAVDPETGFDYEILFPRLRFSMPAVAFEKAAGISGIAENYRLPPGVSPVEVSQYVFVLSHAARQGDISSGQHRALLSALLESFKKDNPSLCALRCKPDDTNALCDVIHGVTSGFCVKDIQHFIDGNYFRSSMQNPAYKALYHKVQNLSGGSIAWVPAPETLQMMEQLVSEKISFAAQNARQKKIKGPHQGRK